MTEARAPEGAEVEPKVRRRILGTLFLIVFIDLVGFGMVVTLLPRYGELYAPSSFTLGFFMSTYSLFQFLFAPILGRLSDRVGRRPVLLISLLGAAAGYALLGVGGSMTVLFLSRIVSGASAGNIATAQAVIADVTGPEGRARGMGIIGAAFGLGFIVGPAVGGVLFTLAPWMPGVVAAVSSLAAFAMCWSFLPETHTVRAERPSSRPRFDLRSLGHALAHPHLGLCLLAFFLAVYGFANFEASFVLYAEHRFLLDARGTGWIFLFVGVVGAVVQGGLIGRLTRVFGEPRLVVFGLLASSLAFGFMPYMPTLGLLVPILGLLAVGTGLVNPSLSSLTSRVVDPDEVGGVLGLFQAMGSLGRIVGPFTGVVAFQNFGQAWPFRIATLLTLGACALAVLLMVRLRSAGAGLTGNHAA